jgi:hypothetical protein
VIATIIVIRSPMAPRTETLLVFYEVCDVGTEASRQACYESAAEDIACSLQFCRQSFWRGIAMTRKREVTTMETQPIHRQIEAATPMATIMSNPNKAARRAKPAITPSQADTARKRSLKKQRSMLRD